MRDYFHCYSKRLACFIMAFGIRYDEKLTNQKKRHALLHVQKNRANG